jgi:CheY-like chemotaxis protein
MDIKMPVMDGYSATIKIKELSKQVVVVAQTAYALASDREKALAAGCDDYLAKPLMKKDLFSVIVKFFN